MARLWISHTSDLRKGTGSGASEEASASIYWGSVGDSKLCASIEVIWRKGADQPSVTIKTGKNIILYQDKADFKKL
jgi:hypothetical protein